MDIGLVGILLASVAILAVLVYLMCRDAMSESWLAFSTQSRQQMRREEKRKGGIKEELNALAEKLLTIAQKCKKQRAPEKPPAAKQGFLSNPYVRIFLASFALFMLFFGYFFLTAKPPLFETIISEEPLAKVAQLSLEEGEYTYSLKTNGTSEQITYTVAQAPSCVGYLVLGEDKSQLCIGKNGQAAGEGKSGMSATQKGAFYLFSPWMLAAKEGWKWGVNATVLEKNLGVNYTARIEYSFVSNESVHGRLAYKISIKTQGQPAGAVLVDSEKRILLLQNSTLGEVSLVKAPFLK